MDIDSLDEYDDVQELVIEDTYDDEFGNIPIQNDEPASTENNNVDDNEGTDVVKAFLQRNGIKDINHIKFQEDNGLIVDKSWNDLTAEEQYNILSSVHRDPDTELSEDEIKLINSIRTSQLTPDEYIKNLTSKVPDNQQLEEDYDISQWSDDDVFMLDLVSRFEDLTEEEAAKALEQAKSNEEIFKKQIAAIRANVQARKEYEAKERETALQQQKLQFTSSILDGIENLKNIGSMDLSLQLEEMEDLAQYILNTDSGASAFGTAMNDPKNIVKAAWFLKHGEEAFDEFNRILQSEIKKARQEGYNAGKAQTQESKVVVKPNTTNLSPKFKTLEDLY